MTMLKQTSVSLTAGEYAALLAKLANQLETYTGGEVHGEHDQATFDFKMCFVKMDKACPYDASDIFETTLMAKFRGQLADFYERVSH